MPSNWKMIRFLLCHLLKSHLHTLFTRAISITLKKKYTFHRSPSWAAAVPVSHPDFHNGQAVLSAWRSADSLEHRKKVLKRFLLKFFTTAISLYGQTEGLSCWSFPCNWIVNFVRLLWIYILMLRKTGCDVQCFRSERYRARDVHVFQEKEWYLEYFQDKKREMHIICWYFTKLKYCIFMPEPSNNHLNL